MDPVNVGVLGCGTISDAYLGADDRFDAYEIVACADIDTGRAREKAAEYDLEAHDPEGLYDEAAVDLVVNLTPPSAHADTCRELLAAGKHVYVEKPLAATPAEATDIVDRADSAGLLVGSAPDTFLGAGLQTCRSVLDRGDIGEPVGATAVWVSGGHESWHPDPDLYYQRGGGPLFDMGPYYVTGLVSLLGPARRVSGSVTRTHDRRTITSERRHGEQIDVEVPTHEAGTIDFADGSVATVLTTFDAPGGSTLASPAFELYGTEGTLSLPNPNNFDGPVSVVKPDEDPAEIELTHEYTAGRGAGVADLAAAIREDWSHRTSATLAAHVLDILAAVREASDRGTHVDIESTVERPDPLPPGFPDHTGD